MDPRNIPDEVSEYCWGPGLFPPGIASNEGQLEEQDDFGKGIPGNLGESSNSNYARMVADKRTDAMDETSGRDFSTLGNVDRYGGNPPLVRAPAVPNEPLAEEIEMNETPRAW